MNRKSHIDRFNIDAERRVGADSDQCNVARMRDVKLYRLRMVARVQNRLTKTVMAKPNVTWGYL